MVQQLTYEELKSSLQHSISKKPLLLVEGIDDVKFFRELIGDYDIDIDYHKCDGRADLLKLFLEKNTYKRPTIYFADKDCYVFTGIPKKYSRIVFTDGYSLENDLLKANLKKISKKLKDFFAELEAALSKISIWYAYNIHLILTDGTGKIDRATPYLLNIADLSATQNISNIDCANQSLIDKINSDPYKYIKGHLLLGILSHVFSYANRIDPLITKYSADGLFDLFIDNCKPYKNKIARKLKQACNSTI